MAVAKLGTGGCVGRRLLGRMQLCSHMQHGLQQRDAQSTSRAAFMAPARVHVLCCYGYFWAEVKRDSSLSPCLARRPTPGHGRGVGFCSGQCVHPVATVFLVCIHTCQRNTSGGTVFSVVSASISRRLRSSSINSSGSLNELSRYTSLACSLGRSTQARHYIIGPTLPH